MGGQNQKRWGLGVLTLVLFLVGCRNEPQESHLQKLARDRVFAVLPDGAGEVQVEHRDMTKREPGFAGGGVDGPSVIVTFQAETPPRAVYRFYSRRALDSGWKPSAKGRLGLVDRWRKIYPGDVTAVLTLVLLDSGPAGYVYRISGSTAPARD